MCRDCIGTTGVNARDDVRIVAGIVQGCGALNVVASRSLTRIK